MNAGEQVRLALQRAAERQWTPPLDLQAVVDGARRRHRSARTLWSAVVLLLTGIGLAVAVARGTGTSYGGSAVSGLRSATGLEPALTATSVPYCTTGLAGDGTELLHVGGRVVPASCLFRAPPHHHSHTLLWHTARTTVMSTPDEVLWVDRQGSLMRLAPVGADVVRISDDGRYVAWRGLTSRRGPPCGDLEVYDGFSGGHVATSAVPVDGMPCTDAFVAGVDDRGRVYLDRRNGTGGVTLYSVTTRTWAPVRGLPPGAWGVSYVTNAGVAVFTDGPRERGGLRAGRSIEGIVTDKGLFLNPREAPIGRAVWSGDHSHLVQLSPEGLVVQARRDLANPVLLALPSPDIRSIDGWDAQWESPDSVLVQLWTPLGDHVFRCSAMTGVCSDASALGTVALSSSATPGG